MPTFVFQGFYKSPREDVAMHIVLFFLPGIVCRLPKDIGTMLDLGAGSGANFFGMEDQQHLNAI